MKTNTGVALILVLGLLAVLFLLAGGFMGTTNIHRQLAALDQTELQAHYLARAGVEKAISHLRRDTNVYDALGEPWRNFSLALGRGQFAVEVTDEHSKVNINTASSKMLTALLNVSPQDVPSVISPIIEFRQNTPFSDVKEIALVKTPTGRPIPKPFELLTVYGDGRVNVNTASLEVLTSIPGIDALLAQSMIDYRDGDDNVDGTDDDVPFRRVQELLRLDGLTSQRFRTMEPFVTVSSAVFVITSSGTAHKLGRKRTARVEAVVRRDAKEIVIERWLDRPEVRF